MKSQIKRFSKSTLSVILSLCMLVSCMTVGLIATDAAQDNSDALSYYHSGGTYYMKGSFNNWGELSGTNNSGNTKQHYYYIYAPGSSSDADITFKFKEEDSGDGNNKWFGAGDTNSIGTSGKQIYADGGENIHLNRKNLGTTSTTWYKLKIWFEHDSNCYCWYGIDATKTELTPTITTKNGSTSTDTFTSGDTVSLSTSTTQNFGTVTYTYRYKIGNGSWNDISGTSFTPTTAGSYTIEVTANDGGVVQNTNSETARTATATKNITVTAPANPTCSAVSLSQSPSSGTIYAGLTAVTYTATATSPVSNVKYNFKVDGTSVQNTTSNTYTTTFDSAGTKSVTVSVEKSNYDTVTSSAVSTTVTAMPSVYFDVIYNKSSGWSNSDNKGGAMTYDSAASATVGGNALVYKLTTSTDLVASSNYYLRIWDGANNYKPSSEISSQQLLTGSGVSCTKENATTKMTTGASGKYNFYYDVENQKVYVEYPHTVTFDSKGGSAVESQVVVYNGKATQPASNPTKTGYTFDKWVTTDGGSTAFNFSTTSITADTTVYAKWTQNTHSITYNTGTGFSYSNNSTTSAHYGDTISFNVTPSSGYRIASVKYNDGSDHTITSSNNTYSFEMPDADVTVSVTTVKTYTVTLTADTGFASRQYKLGSSGTYVDYTSGTTLTVDTGTDVYFKVTYSTGYQYSTNSGLTVVTANTEFRTGSVTANKTTTITASKINYTVTLNKNASDATAGTASVTATYGDAMPTASVTMPTRTGYTFAGYYDTSAATGGTQYYTAAGASARTWNKTSNTTLYARWTEITGGAIAKAYTSGSASSTGGTVKVGASGTAGATANLSAIGIASSNTVIATKGSHYDFAGWQFSGTKCANLRYRFSDSGAWLTPAEGTTYGTASNTTIYIKTDGSTGITTANAEIHALFTPTQYSLTGVTSPAGKGSVEFYSDLSCEQQINPAVANYGNTVYAKYDPGESGYVLKSFSVSGTGASLGTRNGNIIPVTVGSANVIVTANVMLQYSVTYYVDMHSNEINSLSFAVVAKTGTNTYSVVKDNDNVDCKATLGDAQGKYQLTKQGSSKVYAAAITTPVTLSGSTYSDLYFRITFNGTDYIKKISGGNTSATNCIVDDLINSGEIWLEAKNDPSTPLTVNYATNSEAAVPAAGFRRIYLARPYKWYYTEGNEEKGTNTEWNQIGIYHWGNYPDIGWNECTKMNKLGYSGTGENDYYYYYVDIPKAINGNKVSNIIFQGWGSNQEAGTYSKAQTDNIENIPDSANFYILSKDGNAFVGTKSEEDAVIANYTRYVSSVTMNNTETTAVNIKPTYTGADVTYTSGDEGVVTVDDSGIITPVGRGTTTITAKIYGTIGALVTNEDTTYKDYMIRTTTITVNDPTHLSTDGFEIMSLQSETYTVSIPSIDNDQPGYFGFSNDDMVFTVTGLKGVNKSTNSAIIFDISTGSQPNSFKIKYAKANTVFSGYSGIRVVGDIVTKSILNTSSGKRYGLDYWKKYTGSTAANPNPNYTNSKTIDNGVETVVTKGIIFGKDDSDNNVYDRFEAIFAEYDYVDVTFTFTYWEYNPQKVDVNETPLDDSDDMINYFYDATWAGGEDTSNANFAASHTQKTVTVQNYEVRGKTASNVQAADLVTPARTAIGVRPDNNYYNYSIEASNIIIPESDRDPDHFTANAAVNIAHSVKHYSVYLNGSTIVGTDYTYQQYVEVAPTNQPSDTLWYAVGKNSTAVDTSTDPLLATGSSYKFRVKGNTYLRTVEGSVTDQNFNRSEVDFSHYEVTHRDNTSKEYLLQNFYIADFFSPAEVLDPNTSDGHGGHLPYDDAQFVGGGVVYYSMNGATENNQGTPFANAVSSGYVNGDSSSADYGKINDTAIKEMLKSNIEAQYAKDNIAGTVGEEDAMKAAYGTEIAATKNVEGGFNTGIIYRYLPLNQYTRYGSDEKTVDITVNNGLNITNYTLTTKDQTTQKWGCNNSQTSTADPEIANGKRTIRFTNDQNWDAVFVHFWGGSSASNWPGIRMTDKDNNVFEAVIPADATQIVFNDGCSMPATDENGSYTLDYSVNKNTFRYSNSLQSYQYVYASGNENKATNAGKNMRLYSYYVYSYVTYDQETNVPVTKYEIVLSDNYSDASTYWDGQN